MRRRGAVRLDKKQLSKRIHVAWPVLCKVELEDAINKVSSIIERIDYLDNDDVLVLAMKSVIHAGNEALIALEKTYGE